jgi:multidrug efflux pump subunit AcrA (membrane-fusion protein)
MRRKCLGTTFAGAALLLAGCQRQTAIEPSVQTVTAGTAATIQPDTPERYSATIAPIAQIDLAFKSAGLIEKISQVRGADGRMRDVQAGDQVARDTELALVRTVDYQQRVDQATAQLAQSEAQRAQIEAQLGQSEAQLAQAKANFSEAEIEYTRATNLFQSSSLVKPQFDQAKGRYESLAASVKAAEASVKATESSVKGGEAAVTNARAALNETRLSLSDTSLRAPFKGWVSARNVDRGTLVGIATVGFSMIDTHLVKAQFAVPDFSLKMVRLGQKLPVMLDAIQHALQGVVTSISPQADPKTRVFSIEVTLDNPRDEVRPGMIASLTLGTFSNPAPRLVVPLSAVVRAPSDPKSFAVFRLVPRDGKTYAEAQPIQIGQTLSNSIEVISGLSAGQHVIVLGGSLVRDGQEVRVLP